MESPEWQWYRVQITGKAGPQLICALGPGMAIETFLAVHGVLSYDDVVVCEEVVDDIPEDRERQRRFWYDSLGVSSDVDLCESGYLNELEVYHSYRKWDRRDLVEEVKALLHKAQMAEGHVLAIVNFVEYWLEDKMYQEVESDES